jgi:8-oxo-dGTP diphosphatase
MNQPAEPETGPTLVGIGLIRRCDHFLVRLRPEGTVYAGYWEFPGGKCETGESPAQATARECHEETGLQVVVVRLRRTIEHHYAHGHVRLHFFDCEPVDRLAEPLAGSGCRWVLAGELKALHFPEANEPILDELVSSR